MIRKFFCFDLYTTGLVIGWLGLAESIASCIFSILTLENVDSIVTKTNFPNVDDLDTFKKSVIYMFGAYIAFNIIDLLASGLLIAGTVKRNRLLVIPWLINSFITLLFNAATLVLSLIHLSKSSTATVPIAVVAVAIFAIYVYAYIAIYSLYKHIRQSTSSNEYSPLINQQNNAAGYPIYTRC